MPGYRLSRLRPLVLGIGILALIGGFLSSDVRAGTVDNTGPITLLTARLQGRGDAEALFLWEHESRKLAVYLVSGTRMELLFVRNCEHDFEFRGELGGSTPEPKKIKGELNKPGHRDKPEPATSGASGSAVTATAPAPPMGFTLSVGSMAGGTGDLVYIYSHDKQRLNVYVIKGNTLELMFSRNCEYDLRIGNSLGRNKPTVGEMKEIAKPRAKPDPKKQGTKRDNAKETGEPRRARL